MKKIISLLISSSTHGGSSHTCQTWQVVPCTVRWGNECSTKIACGCRYAGFIFAPDQHEIAMQRQATKRTLGKFVDMHGGEEPTEEVWPRFLLQCTMQGPDPKL